MILHHDCRHFRGDVPCLPHKREGVHCENCTYYEPADFSILIVKLDAMGDVLRTTCILPGLREKYPRAHITWLTRKESVLLFRNNPYVDTVLEYGMSSFLYLQAMEYDLVLGLDASEDSTRTASMPRAKERLGYGYDSRGYSSPLNAEAEQWFTMGVFDDIKKQNTRSYQDIVLEICRLKTGNFDIVFHLDDDELRISETYRKKWKLKKNIPTIGVKAGSGKLWVNKKWPEHHAISLIKKLLKEKYQV